MLNPSLVYRSHRRTASCVQSERTVIFLDDTAVTFAVAWALWQPTTSSRGRRRGSCVLFVMCVRVCLNVCVFMKLRLHLFDKASFRLTIAINLAGTYSRGCTCRFACGWLLGLHSSHNKSKPAWRRIEQARVSTSQSCWRAMMG